MTAPLLRPILSAPVPDANACPSAVFVFGDSLCDPGNLAMAAAAGVKVSARGIRTGGRFCDGPTFAEYLADGWGLEVVPVATGLTPGGIDRLEAAFAQGGINFAHGHARTAGTRYPPSLLAQAGTIAGPLGALSLRRLAQRFDRTLPQSALVVIGGGANDYRTHPREMIGRVPKVMAALRQVAESVHALGGRQFVLAGLPDIGLTPAARLYGPRGPMAASLLARAHNLALGQLARSLRGQGIDAQLFDAFAAARAVLEQTDLATTAIFVDALHPSTYVHRHMAQHLRQAIARWWPQWPVAETRANELQPLAAPLSAQPAL